MMFDRATQPMTPDAGITPVPGNKVPIVTLGFWLIKILSTTVGETAADYLAVDAGLGAAVTGSLMGGLLLVCMSSQILSRTYRPWLYWLTVVLVSIVGTQLTDFLTDGLGVSLYVSSAAFALLLAAIFSAWHAIEHALSIQSIVTRRREAFYWVAVLCTFALGTAAGDLATEAVGLGFRLGVLVFGMSIALVAAAWRVGLHEVSAFWIAYILTRPFGAALGDWLTQSPDYGGLGLGAMRTSALFLTVIVLLVAITQRAANGGRVVAHVR